MSLNTWIWNLDISSWDFEIDITNLIFSNSFCLWWWWIIKVDSTPKNQDQVSVLISFSFWVTINTQEPCDTYNVLLYFLFSVRIFSSTRLFLVFRFAYFHFPHCFPDLSFSFPRRLLPFWKRIITFISADK